MLNKDDRTAVLVLVLLCLLGWVALQQIERPSKPDAPHSNTQRSL
jgi:hypothetical protein